MRTIIGICMLSILSTSAWAIDVDTLVDKQRELMGLKIDSQIQEERNKATARSAASAASTVPNTVVQKEVKLPAFDPKEMQLTGLFGIGNNLEAHIRYHGLLLQMRPGMEFEGWRLAKIEERSVLFSKVGERKSSRADNGDRKMVRLYLSEAPIANNDTTADASSSRSSASSAASLLPPLPLLRPNNSSNR